VSETTRAVQDTHHLGVGRPGAVQGTRISPGAMTGEILIERVLDVVNRSPSPDH
jgi:hypothetical protein